MPNYGLVVTPTYNPMSYEQYIQPFRDYAQVYNATADQIDALEMEANQWERLADSDIDAPQYQQYKSYADDLRKYADELATQGLSGRTRAGLSRMRQRYAKEIKPIEEAFNYRQKMAEEQRKLNPKGDMQYTVDFSNVGLGAIMANPSMGYSGRSLSDMEDEGFKQAQAASSRKIITQKAAHMGNQYYQILQGYGQEAASAFLQQAMLENPSEYQELVGLYNQIRDSYGTTSESSPYSAGQNALADERILNGMMKGLALQDSYQTNHWAMPSANRGSGSGSGDAGIEAIGYSKILNGREYTVTYEAGYPKYYDQAGNEYVPDFDDAHHNRYTFKDSQGNKHTIDFDNQSEEERQFSDRRYGVSPVNNSGTMVYVVDLWNRDSSGQPKKVTQNGKNVTYDRSKQRWNPITKRVEDLEQAVKGKASKVPKHPATRVIVGQTTGIWGGNRIGESKTLSKDDVEDLTQDKLVSFEDLTASELSYIPDDVKAAPNNYLFYRYTDDAPGRIGTGDNDYIVYVPVSTVQSEEEAEEEVVVDVNAID